MATWKKIITSGSAAELSSLTLDTGLANSELANSSVNFGGVTLNLGGSDTTPAFNLSDATGYTGDSNLVTVGALDSGGSITSGFGNIDIGTSTLNAGNTTVDNFTNNSAVASSHFTGSFSGSFVGDGSNLTGVAQDIDTLSAGSDIVAGDKFLYSNNGTEESITFGIVSSSIFANISGDATIAAGGALTIENNAIETDMITDANVTLAKIANAAANTVIVRDANSSGVLSAKAVTDTQILIGDGDGFTAAALSGDVTMTNAGVVSIGSDKVGNTEIDNTANVTLGSLTTTNNVTVGGDLVVNGTTTTVSSTNVTVGDAFMFLATGSQGTNVDAGIVVQSGSVADTGSAFYHDTSDQRWAVGKDVKADDTAVTPTSFVTTVKTDTVNPDTTSGSYGAGEMHVNTSTGEIWIRFG